MNTSEVSLESPRGARAPWWRFGAIMHVLPVVALLASGCSAFRADIGIGAAIGVEVQIPAVLHTGLGWGSFCYVGHEYENGWCAGKLAAFITLALLHLDSDEADHKGVDHFCWGVLPIVTSNSPILPQDWQRLEVRVYALFFGARLGINPWNLFSPPAPREF